jgi:hypothetical protein|tara:strand:+ start:487 stop:1230 length:744 start_codon:yes stop_codon:yes gene_type:complete
MLKRPPKRVPVSPYINTKHQVPGGLVHDIVTNHSVTIRPKRQEIFARQNVEEYKRLLKRNYAYYDVPYKEPNVIETVVKPSNEKKRECLVDYLDKVYVKLNILKSGKVRIKLVTNFVSFWKTYYSKGKAPPFKVILAACKALGYSEKFLNKMVDNRKKRQDYVKVLEKIIANIFEKSAASKKKVVKKVVKVKEVDEEDPDVFDTEVEEEEETNNDDAEENEAIVEEDGEGDADEVVEEGVEEVYDED